MTSAKDKNACRIGRAENAGHRRIGCLTLGKPYIKNNLVCLSTPMGTKTGRENFVWTSAAVNM